jgi:5,10-methylenetetrahydrofolate reductase
VDFRYAADLVEFVRSETDLAVGVAGYPFSRVHPASTIGDTDTADLAAKLAGGFGITQFFFDAETSTDG